MLRSVLAAAVIASVLVMAFVSDVLAAGVRLSSARRFDRAYARNRAARRPDLHVVRGGRHVKR